MRVREKPQMRDHKKAIHLTTENELKPRRHKFEYKELTICKYLLQRHFSYMLNHR